MTRLIIAVFLSLFVLAPPARAANAPKFGYVDVSKILTDSKSAKQAKEQLEKSMKERQSKIEAEKKALETMKADYEKNNLDLSERQKQAKQKEFQDRSTAFQKLVADARKEMGEKDAELTKKVVERMRNVVTDVAKTGDYTLVVEKTSTSVLYSKDGLDITDKVIAQMNAQN